MKSPRILLATLALSGAPLLATHSVLAAPAAPVAAPATPATPAAKPMNAGAVALFDKSIKAYAALDQLSQKFVIVDSTGGVAQPKSSGEGKLQIQKPDKARIELNYGGEKPLIYVANGTEFYAQPSLTSYQKQEISAEEALMLVVSQIRSAASLPLQSLMTGDNPLNSEDPLPWEDVKQISLDGMPGVSMQLPAQGTQSPVVFKVFLDPKTDLIARVEAATSITKKPGEAAVPYSNVTTFTTDNSAITPATFQYSPPAGAKLITEADQPKRYDARLVVGAKPFALTGKTLEGKALSLDSYKGKVVLLDFWATWCGPCVGELPNVQANYKTYKPKGFDIIGISLDEDEGELRDFVKAKKMEWPEIFDGKGWAAGDAKAYGVQAIPFTLLIGKDGNIAAVNPRGNALEPAIKAALAK